MNTVKYLLVMLAVGAFVDSCSKPPAANTKSPAGSNNTASVDKNVPSNSPTSALRAVGRDEPVEVSQDALYKQNCMICHKDTGKGGKITLEGKSINPIDLTSARTKAKSDEKLLTEIKGGVPDEGMPEFGSKLSDEQISSIIRYIRTLK